MLFFRAGKKKSGRESLFLALFLFFHGQKTVFTGKNLRIFTGSIFFSRALCEPTSRLFSGSSKHVLTNTQEILRKKAIRDGRAKVYRVFFGYLTKKTSVLK